MKWRHRVGSSGGWRITVDTAPGRDAGANVFVAGSAVFWDDTGNVVALKEVICEGRPTV